MTEDRTSDDGGAAEATGSTDQDRATADVTAASEGYGGPVSDDELAEVYLPAGQQQVEERDERTADGASEPPD